MGSSDHQVVPAITCGYSFSTVNACFLRSRTFPKNFSQTGNIRWQRKGPPQKTGSPGDLRKIPGTQCKIIDLPCFPWTFGSGSLFQNCFPNNTSSLSIKKYLRKSKIYRDISCRDPSLFASPIPRARHQGQPWDS